MSWILEKFISIVIADGSNVTSPVVAPPVNLFPNPLGVDTFQGLIQSVVGWLIYIAGPLLVLMILYGAFLILTAAGDPEKFRTGKNTILYAVIGFIILLISYGIVAVVNDVLGSSNSQGPGASTTAPGIVSQEQVY